MAVVDGDRQLAALGVRLKAAGDVGITRAVRSQIRLAAKPLIPLIQESARASLPKRGGMNEYVAKRKPRTSVRFGPRTAGVSIQYRGKGAPSDKGPWRHPVFGNRNKWVTQTYTSAQGWWERAEIKGTPIAEAAMRTVLRQVADDVNRLGL